MYVTCQDVIIIDNVVLFQSFIQFFDFAAMQNLSFPVRIPSMVGELN